MTRIVWTHSVQQLFLELPEREREADSVATVGFKREIGWSIAAWPVEPFISATFGRREFRELYHQQHRETSISHSLGR